MEAVLSFILFPIKAVAWVISLPIRGFVWVASLKKNDPERTICPGCGFRGDSGTGGKSVVLNFRETQGAERAAIQCTCLRCGNNKFFLPVYAKVETWMAKDHTNGR